MENIIVKITFTFALDVISYTETLKQLRKFNLANQLFKSGTSIGANVRESQGAESKADFIHKIKVAYKEAEETKYWLELCLHSKNYPDPTGLLTDIDTIIKILGKILGTSKRGTRS